MNAIIKTRILSFATVILLLTSCSNPEGDLKKAEQANTEQAYREFIQKHQESPLVARAQADLERLAYATAKREGSPPAYEKFLKRFPQSSLVKDAQADLESASYQDTKHFNTANAYQTFLSRFPGGDHAVEAKAALENAEFLGASSNASIAGWRGFLTKYLQSPHTEAASSNLSELSFKAATDGNTVVALEAFLAEFPSSPYRQDAMEKLAPLVWKDVRSTNTIPAYESFLNRFGNTSVNKQASNALVQLEYEVATNANTIDDYDNFLKRFPQSALNADVKLRIERQVEERDWNQTLLKNTTAAYSEFWKVHPTATRFKVYRMINPGRDGFTIQLHAKQIWFSDGGRKVGGEVSDVVAIGTGTRTRGIRVTLVSSGTINDGSLETQEYGILKVSPPENPATFSVGIQMTDESAVRIREALETKVSGVSTP